MSVSIIFKKAGPTEIIRIITNSDDDGHYQSNNSGRYFTSVNVAVSYSNRIAVMRFVNLAIPNGATIDSAFIRFRQTSGTGTHTATIYGIDQDDFAVTPVTYTWNQFNALDRTSNSVPWSIPATSNDGSILDTPDFSEIIKEIVDRPGWEAGNSITIRINGTGPRVKTFASVDHETYEAPELHVIYS